MRGSGGVKMHKFKKISNVLKVIRKILEFIWLIMVWIMDFNLSKEFKDGHTEFILVVFLVIPLGVITIFGILDCIFFKLYLKNRKILKKIEREESLEE